MNRFRMELDWQSVYCYICVHLAPTAKHTCSLSVKLIEAHSFKNCVNLQRFASAL